jgi:hypothetical protein
MPQFIITLVIGLIAGVMSGMFGIGGGVIIVPALIVFLTYEVTMATGTSLGALMLPVGVFAAMAYYRAGLLRPAVAAPVAVGLLIFTIVGAKLALNMPKETLRFIYGIFLLYNSWKFIEPRKIWAEYRQRAAQNSAAQTEREPEPLSDRDAPVPYVKLLGIGSIAGVASGLFGIGGGVVIVPALINLLDMDQKEAVGTSLGALLLPVGILGVIEYYNAGELNLMAALGIAIGLAVGAFGGSKLALSLPSKTVKRLYGVFLLFVGLRFIGLF